MTRDDCPRGSFKRMFRRIRAIMTKRQAVKTGRPGSITVGCFGRRRTLHFRPDGTSECHLGAHCVCDINWILSSLRDK